MTSTQKITEKFERLLSEGEAIQQAGGWDGRTYQSGFPDRIVYRRFRTEALNLVRVTCGSQSDHYQELCRIAEGKDSATNSYFFKDCLGVLQAAKRDLDDGLLFDLRALVAAEVLGDFIDQAEVLLEAGYDGAAVSVAGAVLEDALRKLCAAHNLSVPEKTTIAGLNAELARIGVYEKLVFKRIIALADLRNDADHGHFDKVSKDDARDMVRYVRRFCTDHLA